MTSPLRMRAVVVTFVVLAAVTASGQFRQFGARAPIRFPTADVYDGGFNYCRGMYTSGRRDGSGNGWTTDYPDADINFSIRLSELTKTPINVSADGSPNHLVVRLGDPALFRCPFVMMTDVGELMLSDDEVVNLRRYFDQGGFLWADDFWGSWSWASWVAEIERVFPPGEFPIRDVAPDHPIFRTLFEIAKVPQIPSINSWRGLGGATSELGADSAVATMRAISDARGRIMVLMTHNTDISDAWEREAADPRYFYSFSPDGYAVGLNVALYAMSH